MTTQMFEWEALSDPESGSLGRPAISDAMPVPELIERDDEGFVFDFMGPLRSVRPPTGLLGAFIDLKSDSALIGFAKRYGPLAVFRIQPAGFIWPDPQRLAGCCETHREEIAAWRKVQDQMKLALTLFAAVRNSEAPAVTQIDDFCQNVEIGALSKDVVEAVNKSEVARRDLALRVGISFSRRLVQACQLRPALRVKRGNDFDVVFQDAIGHRPGGALSLAGALTVQLMASCAGSGLAVCSSCGRAFFPKRQPAFRRNRYCPDCGIKASWRDSKRELRRKSANAAKSRRSQ